MNCFLSTLYRCRLQEQQRGRYLHYLLPVPKLPVLQGELAFEQALIHYIADTSLWIDPPANGLPVFSGAVPPVQPSGKSLVCEA